MTRSVIIGERSPTSVGIFIAPPGIDAMYASDDQLTMNVSSKISQLIMFGWLASSQTIALGLSRSPYVFLHSRETLTDLVVYSGLTGAIRPSPSGFAHGYQSGGGVRFTSYPPSFATINGNGASMSLTVNQATAYAVYNAPFT